MFHVIDKARFDKLSRYLMLKLEYRYLANGCTLFQGMHLQRCTAPRVPAQYRPAAETRGCQLNS